MIAEAEAEGTLTEHSEVRVVLRGELLDMTDKRSVDCSLSDTSTCILPGVTDGVPDDRRYGLGCLVLAHEQTLRQTPRTILNKLDW